MPKNIRCVIFALTACSAGALAGPDWVEGNDAGSLIGTAQQTLGVGQINSISGTLGGQTLIPDFEDMYLITVQNPAIFSMTIPGANFDAQLFIFNVTIPGQAFGLLANDNTINGFAPVLTPLATDATGAAVAVPGVYAVAVAGAGRFPVSINGAIYFYGSPTEISGPDGPGGINPHTGWTGNGATGEYTVTLTGAGFYNVPAPGTASAFLALGALAARRRRR